MTSNSSIDRLCVPFLFSPFTHTFTAFQDANMMNNRSNDRRCIRVDAVQLHASLACALPLTTIVSTRAPSLVGFM